MANKNCKLCKKKLVPIGTSRANGNIFKNDWENREYHKKCWLEIKKLENNNELNNNSSSDESNNNSSSDRISDYDYLDMNIKENIPKWTSNIPKLIKKNGVEKKWQQEKKCVYCGRTKYNPVFFYGFRQICKICLGNNTKELIKIYGKKYIPKINIKNLIFDFISSDENN